MTAGSRLSAAGPPVQQVPAATHPHPNPAPPQQATDATFFNDASVPAADPYVLYDKQSGYYYAYCIDGAQKGSDGASYTFGVYRSADLATWEHLPGGALPMNEPNRWGKDWFWAPEVYHNDRTGKYFLFYSARQRDNVARDFGFADFEEPSKVGVAVADSPIGPFLTISADPLDYFPYDPDYHDVNLIMDAGQRKPPATLAHGETAPLGSYLPFIDADVYFDDDGRIYLYFSRNAYRNWVWDTDLHKYIEESNIYAVELTRDWLDDPTGSTKPTITDDYRNAKVRPGAPAGARRDGYVPIVSYAGDKQPWENAHVNDNQLTGGAKKDRRWAEGSSTFKRYVDSDGGRVPVYYLTYSANISRTPFTVSGTPPPAAHSDHGASLPRIRFCRRTRHCQSCPPATGHRCSRRTAARPSTSTTVDRAPPATVGCTPIGCS